MRVLIWLLCAAGLFVSVRMQWKAIDASHGRLGEASVVQTSRARLFGGVPNSAFGIVYYLSMALAAFWLDVSGVRMVALCVAILAAAVSVYLAYSLLFVTRMPCINCWIGHVTNWLIVVALVVSPS